MSALIATQRYNWMGYNGTETQEVNTSLLRADKNQADNYSYAHRQQVIEELKERLYHIKRDLDLIPADQLQAEEEARQRRRAERKRREEEAAAARAAKAQEEGQAEEELDHSAEREAQRAAEEEARRREEAEAHHRANRWRSVYDSDEDSDMETQRTALAAIPRSKEDIAGATQTFSKGVRMLLARNACGYVSYIDGTTHASIQETEEYNETMRPEAEKALARTKVAIPAKEKFSMAKLQAATAEAEIARKKLDAIRAKMERTYAARIRSSEKDAQGRPLQQLAPEDTDPTAMAASATSARQHAEEMRKAYNARAASSGKMIAGALCTHPIEASERKENAAAEEQKSEEAPQRIAMAA